MVSDDQQLIIESLRKKPYLVDVRTPEEFIGGNVENSVNIPLNQVPDRLTEFKNKDQIIVFCRSGNRSNKVKQLLQKEGFDNVLNGGTWKNIDHLIQQ